MYLSDLDALCNTQGVACCQRQVLNCERSWRGNIGEMSLRMCLYSLRCWERGSLNFSRSSRCCRGGQCVTMWILLIRLNTLSEYKCVMETSQLIQSGVLGSTRFTHVVRNSSCCFWLNYLSIHYLFFFISVKLPNRLYCKFNIKTCTLLNQQETYLCIKFWWSFLQYRLMNISRSQQNNFW